MQGTGSATQTRVVVLGGANLDAIGQIVGALPACCGLAVVVACTADRALADALRATSALPVEEVRGEVPLVPDRVYVLPRDAGIGARGAPLAISALPGAAWSLDRVLRSLAEQARRAIAAVVLGPTLDGVGGVEWIKAVGGLAIGIAAPGPGDDQPPGASLTRLVDLVLAPPAIAARLVALGLRPPAPPPIFDDDEPLPDPSADAFRDILALLRERWAHDFTSYKRATLLRRIERRMQLCEIGDLVSYHRHLSEHPGELAELRRDLLIRITSFFRDPAAFDALERRVIPALFAGKGPTDQLRIWVPGCSTGEEAYSLAILLAEHARRMREPPRIRIFATDIEAEALAHARAGSYPDAIQADLTPERLRQHFVRTHHRFHVHGPLREMLLLSPHDVLHDPPFSRLDLISCRNLLLYLSHAARDRVLESFHFGLRPGGFLFLGSSESAEGRAGRFGVHDAKHRIYVRWSAPLAAPRERGAESVTRGLHVLRDRLRSAIDQFEGLRAAGGEHDADPQDLRSVTDDPLWVAVRAARLAVIGFDADLQVTWGSTPGTEPWNEPSRMLEVLGPGQASRLLELARGAAASGRSRHAELELVLDGGIRTYDFLIEPAGDGAVAIGFDVTPAKLAQATLLEADRRKDEFLATLSHELRHPLTPLRVALDVARLADHDPDQRARSLAIMERQVVQLTRLVDDLFDLSRIAHGKLELERSLIDPVEVVNAALEAAKPLLDERGHRLELQLPGTPVRIVGDFYRLVQVVTNLLSNAAKYTPTGGRIDLELRVEPLRRMLEIRVHDTGIGIPEELLANIFELFVQGRDARGSIHRGLGVGLNLVRRIVELHGGTVVAASPGVGQGSEFVVELPIAGRPDGNEA